MFEPIETGRETQWFHTKDVDDESGSDVTQYDSEMEAIEAAIARLSRHLYGGDRDSTEMYSIDWQLYTRTIIHEVVETARGLTTSTTTTPLVKGTVVRLTLIPGVDE